MTDRSPASETALKRKHIEAGQKVALKRKHVKAGQKAAEKVKNNQWDPKKVDYLVRRTKGAKSNACVICGDSRPKVLHNHHADEAKTIVVKLCANCHDIVRRGTLEDLEKAHRWGRPLECG